MGPTRTVKSSIKGTRSAKKPGALATKPKSIVSKKPKAPPPKQQKTKPAKATTNKKKKRVYTDKELGIPKLNMIIPVGVNLQKGKKGKVFVDDQESMMTIFAIVNANKEGQIESKMMKSRQMEEIREARRREAEARQEQRKSKLEEKKDSIRKKRKRKPEPAIDTEPSEGTFKASKVSKAGRKRVSFA